MLDYLTILRMHYSQNLSFREIGASVGCGKTAVGRFITRFEESEFTQARAYGRSGRVITNLVKTSCLIIDEVGHCVFDKENTRMFFVDRCYNKKTEFLVISLELIFGFSN